MSQIQTEQAINEYLQVSLKTYFALRKQGRDKLADAILAYASSHANLLLTIAEIRKSYTKPRCYRCGIFVKDVANQLSVCHTGLCLACEHTEAS